MIDPVPELVGDEVVDTDLELELVPDRLGDEETELLDVLLGLGVFDEDKDIETDGIDTGVFDKEGVFVGVLELDNVITVFDGLGVLLELGSL